MTINEFLEATYKGLYNVRDRLVCADGFSMSVQAARFAYCDPREDLPSGFTSVEVGFPSQRVEELLDYAEDQDNPTATVYGYVPVEIVEAVCLSHGGIVLKEKPKSEEVEGILAHFRSVVEKGRKR